MQYPGYVSGDDCEAVHELQYLTDLSLTLAHTRLDANDVFSSSAGTAAFFP